MVQILGACDVRVDVGYRPLQAPPRVDRGVSKALRKTKTSLLSSFLSPYAKPKHHCLDSERPYAKPKHHLRFVPGSTEVGTKAL